MNKTIRLLKLIDLLSPPGKTKKALANALEIDVRSIERYIRDDLPALDIEVEYDDAGRHYAFSDMLKGVKVALTSNEADFISDLMMHSAASHPLTQSIQTKLFFRSGIEKRFSDNIRKNVPTVIKDLSFAMKLNRQIEILDYYSAYQGKLRSRKVEPLFYTINYRYLIAYEAAEDLFVNIKIDRISKVQMVEEKCTKSPDATTVDIFQMAFNKEKYPVCLLLTSLAYRVLVEERPGSDALVEPYEDETFPFKFSATIATLFPISRYCMGLPGHIKIVESEALRDFLIQRKEAFLW